jgi:hypothetical protein
VTAISAAPRFDAPSDPEALLRFSQEQGWGDGLPLIPPTPARVQRALEEWGMDGSEIIAELPPSLAPCTAERLAANTVMAGAPAAALPLLAASIKAVADPGYELHALQATTGSVTTAMLVNGPVRHALDIPFGAGCLGGADGGAAAIGRAFRLVMRNVAGQRIGVSSQSTYGQPGRVTGIVFAEWEERSPWAPLAERRGVPGDAVTVFGTMGTVNICDPVVNDADVLIEYLGRALPYSGANGFLVQLAFAEILVAINPVWAQMIGRAYPDVDDVRQLLWGWARLPLSHWPEQHRDGFVKTGWVDEQGFVPLARRPEDVIIVVAGGLGGLHAAALHSWGTTIAQTRAVSAPDR